VPTDSYPTTPTKVIVDVVLGYSYRVDFENSVVPPYKGVIYGFKFEDLNGDGVWDSGEPGVDGVTITVSREGYTGKTTTNQYGIYFFELDPETYSVEETVPGGWANTTLTKYDNVPVEENYATKVDDFGNIKVDDTPPVITCPQNVTIQCGASDDPKYTGYATATDDSGVPPVITWSGRTSGSCPETITRTWTATDAAGNFATCDQTITVTPGYWSDVPPQVTTDTATGVTTDSATLNGNLTSLGTAVSVYVSFEWGLTTSYGNETTPQTMTDTGAGNETISGLDPNTTYHFRAKAAGFGIAYGDDMTFTTTTDDNTPPVVTITDPDDGGYYQTATLPPLAYTVTDNLDPSPTVEVSGWSTDEGAHTVTVTATDAAGNVGSDSVTYTVDNTAPVVTITDPDEGGYYQTATLPPLAYTVTDNLDPSPTVEVSGWSTDEGTHTVTVTATDAAGNVGSDSVTYTITPTSPPAAVSIEVTPESASIAVGQTQQFTATAKYPDGSTADVTDQVIWTSDESIATIDDTGLATGVATGTTEVNASLGTITSVPAELTVSPAVPWSTIGGIIGGVLAAGGFFFLLWRRRKKKKSTEEAPA